MLPEVRISSALYEDLPEVARIHVEAWKKAYIGQISQAYLDRLNVEQRLQRWREQFSTGIVSGLLVANVEGQAAGFICLGRARDADRGAGRRYTRFMCSNPIGAVASGISYSNMVVLSFSAVAS